MPVIPVIIVIVDLFPTFQGLDCPRTIKQHGNRADSSAFTRAGSTQIFSNHVYKAR